MNFSTSISKVLNDIRLAHASLPLSDEFKVHIEIFSTDSSVGLHQFINNHKNMTLVRYYDEFAGTFFDMELRLLLTNYLKMVSHPNHE